MTLKNTIEALAQTFAEQVLTAIRGASLEEILTGSGGTAAQSGARPRAAATTKNKGRAERRARRGSEELATTIEAIVLALKDAKGGMRSEDLQKALSLDKKTITRPLTMALAEHMIRKRGEKRATRYFAR